VTAGGEAGDVTDLGDHEQGDEDADAGDAGEDGDARVVLGARLDLPLHGRELTLKVGDQRKQALEPAAGRLGQNELPEQGASAGPEELSAPVLDTLTGKQRIDTILERRAQPSEPDVVTDQLP
jgi:hypothetical protein